MLLQLDKDVMIKSDLEKVIPQVGRLQNKWLSTAI